MKSKISKHTKKAKLAHFISMCIGVVWCIFLSSLHYAEKRHEHNFIKKENKKVYRHPLVAIKTDNKFKIQRDESRSTKRY